MQRRWVIAITLASGLLAQSPTTEPPPAPVPIPAPEPVGAPVGAAPLLIETKPLETPPFDQLRPSQRKLAYHLYRAALSAHELGYYGSHPSALEVRDALEALLKAKVDIPEKAQVALPAVASYLAKFHANHGLYDAEGKKVLLEAPWKNLQAAARAAAKTGPKGLEARLLKLKGLLLDPKVAASTPGWAEAAPAKGRKAKKEKSPSVPEGFVEQKAITALWVKRAQAWVENTPQEVEVKGEKKIRRLPDPVQTKALNELLAWLGKDDLDLLRDPAFGWLDLRRLGVWPGAGLLARASDLAAAKVPAGPAGELLLLPILEPVMGDSRFSKGEDKRAVLVEVQQRNPATDLAEQMATFQKQGRSRELDVK